LQCELQAQVTLNEDAKQRAVITMNSNQPRYTFLCEPTVSSAREGCQQVGINGQWNHLFTPGVLEMARWERVMILGREVSCDASGPLATGRYKATEIRFGRMRIPRGP